MFDVVRSRPIPWGSEPLTRALRRYLFEQVGDWPRADELLAQTLLRVRFGAFAASRDPVATAFAIAQRLVFAQRVAAYRLAEDALNPPRVLVVDDDPELGDSIALALRDASDVTSVESTAQAEALITNGMRYDAIFCSLMTPACAGVTLYCDLLRSAPEMADAVVFLVGAAITSRARAFVDSVGAPCLELPLDAKELRDLVRNRRLRRYDSWSAGRWYSRRE
jgi:CheY-like chemotaxis protein